MSPTSLINRSDSLNERARERASLATNAEVGRRMRQVIHSAVAGLRTELLAMTRDLSLDVVDEVERDIIGCFGPEGAYRDYVSDITHGIAPEARAEMRAVQ